MGRLVGGTEPCFSGREASACIAVPLYEPRELLPDRHIGFVLCIPFGLYFVGCPRHRWRPANPALGPQGPASNCALETSNLDNTARLLTIRSHGPTLYDAGWGLLMPYLKIQGNLYVAMGTAMKRCLIISVVLCLTPSVSCSGQSFLQPGAITRHVRVNGVERAYIVNVPPAYDPEKFAPVILGFHGGASTPGFFERSAIWPNGLGPPVSSSSTRKGINVAGTLETAVAPLSAKASTMYPS